MDMPVSCTLRDQATDPLNHYGHNLELAKWLCHVSAREVDKVVDASCHGSLYPHPLRIEVSQAPDPWLEASPCSVENMDAPEWMRFKRSFAMQLVSRTQPHGNLQSLASCCPGACMHLIYTEEALSCRGRNEGVPPTAFRCHLHAPWMMRCWDTTHSGLSSSPSPPLSSCSSSPPSSPPLPLTSCLAVYQVTTCKMVFGHLLVLRC